jgi:hypothetical protein
LAERPRHLDKLGAQSSNSKASDVAIDLVLRAADNSNTISFTGAKAPQRSCQVLAAPRGQ